MYGSCLLARSCFHVESVRLWPRRHANFTHIEHAATEECHNSGSEQAFHNVASMKGIIFCYDLAETASFDAVHRFWNRMRGGGEQALPTQLCHRLVICWLAFPLHFVHVSLLKVLILFVCVIEACFWDAKVTDIARFLGKTSFMRFSENSPLIICIRLFNVKQVQDGILASSGRSAVSCTLLLVFTVFLVLQWQSNHLENASSKKLMFLDGRSRCKMCVGETDMETDNMWLSVVARNAFRLVSRLANGQGLALSYYYLLFIINKCASCPIIIEPDRASAECAFNCLLSGQNGDFRVQGLQL